MNVSIKSIHIRNFKGMESFEMDFGGRTKIYGENATGKTTLFDAFCWLLFGKNGQGQSQFGIKRLENGAPVHNQDVEVEALLDIDGHHAHIKRVMSEKWVTRRGESEAVFSGHQTSYTWNDVPLKQGEFEEKVSSVISEDLFKLLTNVRYFNNLHWEARRKILFDMAGDVTYKEVADREERFRTLLDRLTGKDVEDYRKELASKRRKIKEELDKVPTRIDEVNRNMPEPVDEAALNKELEKINSDIAKIDEQIGDVVKANEAANKAVIEKQNRVQELQLQLNEVKSDAESKAQEGVREYERRKQELESELQRHSDKHTSLQSRKKDIQNQITVLETEMAELRTKWGQVNAETFQINEDELKCGQCGQDLPEDQQGKTKEKQQAEFNESKQHRLKSIQQQGSEKKARKEQFESDLTSIDQQIGVVAESIRSTKGQLSLFEKPEKGQISAEGQKAIDDLQKQIERAQSELDAPRDAADTSQLKQQRSQLQDQRDEIKSKLSVTEQIKKAEVRIKELEAQQRTLSQQLADLEQDQQVIDDMVKARIELIEQRIAGLFDQVRFRMYEQQINEGEKPTCVTLIDGVPYPDANNAGQINAGIDIINALSLYYGVSAPVFVDNAEAVVNLAETDSQVIALYVSGAHKELHIETEAELAEAV